MDINDEIDALKCIYEQDDVLIFDEKTQTGQFNVKINTDNKPFQIYFPNENIKIEVYNLPPICLEFKLPKNYPSEEAPNFKLTSVWLNDQNLNILSEKLDQLWSQYLHTPILFIWISFIQDEIFQFLSLDPQDFIITTNLASLFIDYNKNQLELIFKKTNFFCNICFVEKSGQDCLKFNKCEHVFCKSCMYEYFKSLISDGNVKKLCCPQEKCDSFATQAQVLSVVGDELFNRYDSLLLKYALNDMNDIVYCPISNCECAVIIEENNLCQCPRCNYVFCALCRKNYHGVQTCKKSISEFKILF